jgi:hypothetical protein
MREIDKSAKVTYDREIDKSAKVTYEWERLINWLRLPMTERDW